MILLTINNEQVDKQVYGFSFKNVNFLFTVIHSTDTTTSSNSSVVEYQRTVLFITCFSAFLT